MPGPGRMGGGPGRGGFGGGPRGFGGGFGGPRGPHGFGHRPPRRPPIFFRHRPPMHYGPYGYGCFGCCLYVIGTLLAFGGLVAAVLAAIL